MKKNNNAAILTNKFNSSKVAEKKKRSYHSPDDGLYRLSPQYSRAYRISPHPSETVVATFHQRSGRKGLSPIFRGYQCTSMALAAIMVSKTFPLQNWKTPDMDAVLRYGDLLHEDLLLRRGEDLTDPRLALHEVPTGEENKYIMPIPSPKAKWFTTNYQMKQTVTLSKSEEFYGLVHSANNAAVKKHRDLGYTEMEDALAAIFDQDFDGILITVGDVSGAVFKENSGRIRYFDSHCNNKWGRLSIDGTAVLLTFDTIKDFTRLIRRREPRVQFRYELIGIKVHLSEENTIR